ncbi:MAG: ABC transporter permease subunit [Anaerolineae bacterium]|jgi:ABC-2 type transport system permease protein|nr:ABC transporter permease subunit [Anaerolineae bacterium]
MRNIWLIATREFKHYFISPIAYVVSFVFLLVMGILFYANILASSVQQYAPGVQIIIGPMVTLFLFSAPAITMHTLADEQRSGTLELMLTAPVRDSEFVIGKWLGTMMFVMVLIAVTWVYPIVLNQMIDPGIDQGLLVTNYLGLILMVGAFMAIGVTISSLFSNQIAAFFATLGVLLVLWMIGYPSQALGAMGGGGLLTYLDISEHFYSSFYRGIIELKDVVYFISLTSVFLFFGTVSIETKRWR